VPEDPVGGHIDEEQLEKYAMNRVSGAEEARIEEHLLVCSTCQQRLREVSQFVAALRDAAAHLTREPVDFIHATEVGPVHLLVRQSGDQGWEALMSGQLLHRARIATLDAANELVLRSFEELFPNHECTDQCGPLNRQNAVRAD
jgi:anti-sigma factor RsiW